MERLIDSIESHIIQFVDSEPLNLAWVPGTKRAAYARRIRAFSGYDSDYPATPHAIPRWLAYPTLRFAHLMQTGLICESAGHSRASRVPLRARIASSRRIQHPAWQRDAADSSYASFSHDAGRLVRISALHIERNRKRLYRSSPSSAWTTNSESRNSAAEEEWRIVSRYSNDSGPNSPPAIEDSAYGVQFRRPYYRQLEINFRL